MLLALLLSSLMFMYFTTLMRGYVAQQALEGRLQLEEDRRLESIRLVASQPSGQLEIVNEGARHGELEYVVVENASEIQISPPELLGLKRSFSRQGLTSHLLECLENGLEVLLVTKRGNVFRLNDPYAEVINQLYNNVSTIKVNVAELSERMERLELSLSNSTTIEVAAGDVVVYHPFFGLSIIGEVPESEWSSSSRTLDLGSSWNSTKITLSKTGSRGLIEGAVVAYGYRQAFSSSGYNFGALYVNSPDVYRWTAYGGCIRASPHCEGSTGYPADGGAYMDQPLESGKYEVVANYYLYNGYDSLSGGSSSASCSLKFAGAAIGDSIGPGSDPYSKYPVLKIEKEVVEGSYRFDVGLSTGWGWLSGRWVLPASHFLSITIRRLGEGTVHNYRFYGNENGVSKSFAYNLKTGELNVEGRTFYLDQFTVSGFNSQVSYTVKQPTKIRLYAPAGTQVYLDGAFVGEVKSASTDIPCSPNGSHELHVVPPG